MQFLSNEKDKLSTKLSAAFKLLESNGLLDQLSEKTPNAMASTTTTKNFTSSSNKSSSGTKINKQYVSAYNTGAAPAAVTTTTTTTTTAGNSLLSSALADCTNDLKTTQHCGSDDKLTGQASSRNSKYAPNTGSPTTTTTTIMPIKSLTTTIARTQLQPVADSDTNKTNDNSSTTRITPIQVATPIQCANTAEINVLLNSGQLDQQSIARIISANASEQIGQAVVSTASEVQPVASPLDTKAADLIPGLLIPSIRSKIIILEEGIKVDAAEERAEHRDMPRDR